MTKQEVKKAVSAGHDVVPEGHADVVENIDAAAPTVPKVEVVAESATTQEVPVVEAPKAKEPKFAGNLFNGFTLGSTLKQGPIGNVLSNTKGNRK